MAAPRKITDTARARIALVALIRRILPSDKELAAESGCTPRGIRTFMESLDIERLSDNSKIGLLAAIESLLTVSRGAPDGTLQAGILSPMCVDGRPNRDQCSAGTGDYRDG